MAHTTIGHVEPFQPGTDDWEQYEERLQQYFQANGLEEDKKRAVFLTVIGAQTYSLLSSLVAPDKPSTKTYEDLTTVLKNHLKPKTLVIAERFKFHKRNQGENESVAAYMAELRKMASKCQFRDYLEEALRDRLVCGLRSGAVQKKLLVIDGLTLQKAYEVAQGEELARKQAEELQPQARVTEEVQYMGSPHLVELTTINQPDQTLAPPNLPRGSQPGPVGGVANLGIHQKDVFTGTSSVEAATGMGTLPECARTGESIRWEKRNHEPQLRRKDRKILHSLTFSW